jgi:hypothetical protein
MEELYSVQTMSRVRRENGKLMVGFFANHRTSEICFSCEGNLSFDELKKFVGQKVEVGIYTSGKVFSVSRVM